MDDFELELRRARRALARADPALAALMRRVGPCRLERSRSRHPYEALFSAIVHQQLNGKAAGSILARVRERFGAGATPEPEAIAKARLPSLRSCGLSRAKALALKDLAAKTLDGTVPASRELRRLADEEIVRRLTAVRGVGPWTVEMLLMFDLGRLDVCPVDDFGVRRGFSLLYGHDPMATKRELAVHSERWRPYRSVASWYLWRVLD
jgi:DNA-3-methyladenine glycosylase II